jgi:hypothetical protein
VVYINIFFLQILCMFTGIWQTLIYTFLIVRVAFLHMKHYMHCFKQHDDGAFQNKSTHTDTVTVCDSFIERHYFFQCYLHNHHDLSQPPYQLDERGHWPLLATSTRLTPCCFTTPSLATRCQVLWNNIRNRNKGIRRLLPLTSKGSLCFMSSSVWMSFINTKLTTHFKTMDTRRI